MRTAGAPPPPLHPATPTSPQPPLPTNPPTSPPPHTHEHATPTPLAFPLAPSLTASQSVRLSLWIDIALGSRPPSRKAQYNQSDDEPSPGLAEIAVPYTLPALKPAAGGRQWGHAWVCCQV